MPLDPVRNFAKVLVSTGYDDTATSIVLTTGHGAKLPAPSTDGSFNLVWFNSTDYFDPGDDPNVEIVRCTARSTDTLTVVRGQEGIAASVKNISAKSYTMILSFTEKQHSDISKLLKFKELSYTLGSFTGASMTYTAAIPAGDVVLGVSCTNLTDITGDGSFTGYDSGVVGNENAWGDNLSPANGFVSNGTHFQIAALPRFAAATDIVLTARGGNFTSGSVLVTVYIIQLVVS